MSIEMTSICPAQLTTASKIVDHEIPDNDVLEDKDNAECKKDILSAKNGQITKRSRNSFSTEMENSESEILKDKLRVRLYGNGSGNAEIVKPRIDKDWCEFDVNNDGEMQPSSKSQYHSISELSSPSVSRYNNITSLSSNLSYPHHFISNSRFLRSVMKRLYPYVVGESPGKVETHSRNGRHTSLGDLMDFSFTQNFADYGYNFSEDEDGDGHDDENEMLESPEEIEEEEQKDVTYMSSSSKHFLNDLEVEEEEYHETDVNGCRTYIHRHSGCPDDSGSSEIDEKMEAKKARVENIIRSMRISPVHGNGNLNSSSSQISTVTAATKMKMIPATCDNPDNLTNSCQKVCHLKIDGKETEREIKRPKRKQYIPQQQLDVSGRNDDTMDDLPPLKVSKMEKDNFRYELLEMQEQITEMQQKYFELMDYDVDTEEDGLQEDEELDEQQNQDRNKQVISDININDLKRILDMSSSENKEDRFNKYDKEPDSINRDNCHSPVTSMKELAKMIKAEITNHVSRLIDNIVKMFDMNHFQSTEVKKKSKEVIFNKHSNHDSLMMNEQFKDELSSSLTHEHPKDDSLMTHKQFNDDSMVVTSNETVDAHHLLGDDFLRKNKIDSFRHPADDIFERNGLTQSQDKVESFPSVNRNKISTCMTPLTPPTNPTGLLPHTLLPLLVHHHLPVSDQSTCDRYFDIQRKGSFSYPQSQLSLFPPPQFSHVSYPSMVGKFHHQEEQTEALPLVVGSSTLKKKRTKVTDSRLSPRASRSMLNETMQSMEGKEDEECQRPSRVDLSFHHQYPVSPYLQSLHDAFPPILHLGSNTNIPHPKFLEAMYSKTAPPPPPMMNHALVSAAFLPTTTNNISEEMANTRNSFMKCKSEYELLLADNSGPSSYDVHGFTSTLTPMHLRKAKLMFLYVRYPSSNILKIYFPDVKFNKNNTAQLVKWFSNFREFYYIQMEKYGREALAEGVRNVNDLVVKTDSEIYRILVLHYNRNNQIEVPEKFRFVVQATFREFFISMSTEKDQEASWKKSIYKRIARMDDPVPEFFKSSSWLEQLVDI